MKLQSPITRTKTLPQEMVADLEALKRKNAIDLVSNQALAARLAEIIEAITEIENTGNPIEQRIARLNRLVVVAGWAWAVAADDEWMDGQLTRWNLVMGRWRDKLALKGESFGLDEREPTIYIFEDADGNEIEVEDDMTPDPMRMLTPKELERLIVGYGERDVIVAGLTILHRTFKDKHVSPMYVAMYQGVAQPGRQGEVEGTSSGSGALPPDQAPLPAVSTP